MATFVLTPALDEFFDMPSWLKLSATTKTVFKILAHKEGKPFPVLFHDLNGKPVYASVPAATSHNYHSDRTIIVFRGKISVYIVLPEKRAHLRELKRTDGRNTDDSLFRYSDYAEATYLTNAKSGETVFIPAGHACELHVLTKEVLYGLVYSTSFLEMPK